jgi:hypothetical protein
MYNISMRSITLSLLTSPSCIRCEEFIAFWSEISSDYPHVLLRELPVLSPEGQAFALRHRVLSAPAVAIEDELVAFGAIDKERFVARLQALSFLQ